MGESTGRTIVEKIVAAHCDVPARAGDLVVARVDVVMAQDGNAPLAIGLLREELGGIAGRHDARIVLVIDHCGPSPNEGASNMQALMRAFAAEVGADLFDIGEGISHVVLPEHGYALPGTVVVGSDSHSVTYGALNCMGMGMGSTDIAVAMATGKAWLRVPESVRIRLTGRLRPGVTAKDLALHLVSTIGPDGATYECLEFAGPGLETLEMDQRFTVCNMAVEMGAKCALMPIDDRAADYLRAATGTAVAGVTADPDARYERVVEVDLADVQRLVALPHDMTRITPAADVEQPIDMAFLGTCTNSRLSDLTAAADVLRGRRVHSRVRMIVTPGSRGVYLEAVRSGLIETFVSAGAVVTPPGCGPCVGTHMGVPGDGEVVISTANRNFKGRMGNRNASILLASPATVAASAVLGRVGSEDELE